MIALSKYWIYFLQKFLNFYLFISLSQQDIFIFKNLLVLVESSFSSKNGLFTDCFDSLSLSLFLSLSLSHSTSPFSFDLISLPQSLLSPHSLSISLSLSSINFSLSINLSIYPPHNPSVTVIAFGNSFRRHKVCATILMLLSFYRSANGYIHV